MLGIYDLVLLRTILLNLVLDYIRWLVVVHKELIPPISLVSNNASFFCPLYFPIPFFPQKRTINTSLLHFQRRLIANFSVNIFFSRFSTSQLWHSLSKNKIALSRYSSKTGSTFLSLIRTFRESFLSIYHENIAFFSTFEYFKITLRGWLSVF